MYNNAKGRSNKDLSSKPGKSVKLNKTPAKIVNAKVQPIFNGKVIKVAI